MAEIKLTENQAQARLKEWEKLLYCFHDIDAVFIASAIAKKQTIDIKKENVLLLKELEKDKERKSKSEHEIADIVADGQGQKKVIEDAYAKQKDLYLTALNKWNKTIEKKEYDYNAMITAKSTEYKNLISARTSELEAKEKRLAKINKEIDDVKKVFMGG